MKLTSTPAFILATALSAVAAPTSAPVADGDLFKRDCLVNARYESDWVEAGLSRYRTYFSSENTPTDAFCTIFKFWATGPLLLGGSNFQCWEEKGVSWMADVSFPRGLAGQSNYDTARNGAMDKWIDQTGCGTG